MAQGRVRYSILAGKNFDPYTTSGDPATESFIRSKIELIGTFSPFFNNKLAWMPNACPYRDSYAVYVDPKEIPNSTTNPEFIIKDVNGNRVFIPWGSPLSQYAGDITQAAFVQYMVSFIVSTVLGGRYAGLWLDDVNLTMRTCDANGNFVAPVDPATHAPMTQDAWASYFAGYLEAIRKGLPTSAIIIHNAIWTTPITDAVKRQIAACNYYNLERGFSDGGITGGSGEFSFSKFMSFIDFVHSLGSNVIMEEYNVSSSEPPSKTEMNFAVASYLLVNNGNDMTGFSYQNPDLANWPAILGTDLGYAVGNRYQSVPGLWYRWFQKGYVIVNEPGAPQQVVNLKGVMFDPDGNQVSSVTLQARQGIVLRYKKG